MKFSLQGANYELRTTYASKIKSTKVQTSPIFQHHALRLLPQSTEPRAVLGSKCIMAKPAQFVKFSER